MYNYENSYLRSFKGQAGSVKPPDKPNPRTADISNDVAVSQRNGIQTVTPDYNVSIPARYTKTGVETLSNGQEVHCYKLNNGQRVYIAPKESAGTILNTYVNTGSMNEKDSERGISHFCEHMAFNGTKGNDGYMKLGAGDVFRQVADMGGYTNASTNFAETNYTISAPLFNDDDFEKMVKIQASMMNNLEMSDNMVDKEHAPVTSEINMYSDMPDNIALNLAIKNLYNINTTSDDVVAGTVDNILNIDSKKVMDYYKNNYYPANMTTVVTGDVDPDEAIEIIAKNFRGENPKKPDRKNEPLKPIEKTIRKDIFSNKAVATTGFVCFNGPANNDFKDGMVINAINYYLFNKKNSKTDKDLENYNVGICAGQDKISSNQSDGKLLKIFYDATEENSETALKSVFSNLVNFKAPDKEEMEVLKTALKMNYEDSYEDMEDLNLMLGQKSLMGGISGCVDAIKIIDSITAQDMVDAVHKYYDTNKASVVVIHPEKANINTIMDNYNRAQSISFTGKVNKSRDKRPLKTEEIDRYTLPNNCDIAVMNSTNDIASYLVNITANAPANVKPGVVEILSSMLTRGSRARSELIDKNNISSYSGATGQSIYYAADLPAKNMAMSLDLMKSLIINPEFSTDDFNRSKQEVKNDLATMQPSASDNLKNTLFPNSPRGYSNKDIAANLDNVTLEDVRGLFKYIMDNGQMTVAACVPVNKYPNSKNVLNDKFSSLKEFKPNRPGIFNDYVPIEKSTVVTDTANTAQADVVQVYKFKHNHTPKEIVSYELMNSILSGGDETGLYNNLREKQKLAYCVYSSLDNSALSSSTLSCRILTTTDSPDLKSYDNVQKSITGFHNQISKMMRGEFTDKELEAAKLSYKQHLLGLSDSRRGKVEVISDSLNSINGLDCNNTLYNMVDEITSKDIQNAAKEVFSTKPVYSVRASKDTLDANRSFFETLRDGE